MKIYDITQKALKAYEQLHICYIEHTKELPKRRITAHIKACEVCGMYRDISPSKSVFSVGNIHFVLEDNSTIVDVFESKGGTYIHPNYRRYLKDFSSELAVSGHGKEFLHPVL